ncbi:MAG: hypothetical protein ACE5FH_07920 [Candidatus Zixiibacteriota bacterium]
MKMLVPFTSEGISIASLWRQHNPVEVQDFALVAYIMWTFVSRKKLALCPRSIVLWLVHRMVFSLTQTADTGNKSTYGLISRKSSAAAFSCVLGAYPVVLAVSVVAHSLLAVGSSGAEHAA